jgi:hypothetical protein
MNYFPPIYADPKQSVDIRGGLGSQERSKRRL